MKGVDLPPLDALIERGKVLALNMPAGTNPALARAVGVMGRPVAERGPEACDLR